MYVIATVSCPNFHFSVSPHVPFLNLLFEQIANSNAYLLAKIGVDTAENEPLEVWGENSIQYSLHSLGASLVDGTTFAACQRCSLGHHQGPVHLSFVLAVSPSGKTRARFKDTNE